MDVASQTIGGKIIITTLCTPAYDGKEDRERELYCESVLVQ